MHATKTLRRSLRPIWAAAAGATVWSNRAMVRSALGFGKKPGKRIHIARTYDSDGHLIVSQTTEEDSSSN